MWYPVGMRGQALGRLIQISRRQIQEQLSQSRFLATQDRSFRLQDDLSPYYFSLPIWNCIHLQRSRQNNASLSGEATKTVSIFSSGKRSPRRNMPPRTNLL